MKRFATIVAALSILTLASSAFATGHLYGWSVSGSPVDPFVNSGAATNGVANLYLWFVCSTVDGMSAAEFDMTGPQILGFNAMNGYLDADGAPDKFLLAVGMCPIGPVVAGQILVFDFPGEYCIIPSAANGFNVTVDCDVNPAAHGNQTTGYVAGGGVLSCDDSVNSELCIPVSVDATSWGHVKGLYR